MSKINNYKQKENWLAYCTKTNELILQNLLTGKENRFQDVADYLFDDHGRVLLIKTSTAKVGSTTESLLWIDLTKAIVTNIWSDCDSSNQSNVSGYTFDATGTQLTFAVSKNSGNNIDNTIWYYNCNMSQSIALANNQSDGIKPNLIISDISPRFNSSGNFIFFNVRHRIDGPKKGENAVNVDVWTYRDSVLQSTQLLTGTIYAPEAEISLIISVSERKITCAIAEDETPIASSSSKNDFLVLSNKKDITEYWWETDHRKSFYLMSLKDGIRKLLDTDDNLSAFTFSPTGKYLVYFDTKKQNYFSYNLLSNKILNISASIPAALGRDDINDSQVGVRKLPVGVACWLVNDESLLIYDNYDIWRIDPSGIKSSLNLTNNYGRSNGIKLRLALDNEIIYSPKENLLLIGFNTSSKQHGFLQKKIDSKEDPELLIMGPFYFFTTNAHSATTSSFRPLKAKNAEKWIVMRQSPTEAPNYFFTKDFKNFNSLTNMQPNKEYNWLTAELINWRQLDGSTSQGILYKPENFDPLKKYPIIFRYYEKLSDGLYLYPNPYFSISEINIPWFVSRGYLVFEPDIHYIIGRTGESIYNSVVSAANYMSKHSWVDESRMGINGHSFGGYETNYLITHTQLFAAAVSGAGISNLTSHYGGLLGKWYKSGSGQGMCESSQMRLGHTLWQRPDIYIANSPIFNIDRVSTPLLIMHNKGDEVVPWMQSVELFTGLRRLRKKVWMLQYDEGTHGLGGKDAADFTIRVTQFFDHYLKASPPPRWMTQGIPSKLKGIEMRYEIDSSMLTP